MSRLTGIDFSKFDLDENLPMDLKTNGHQSSLARWLGKPLREIVRGYAAKGSLDYTGTPEHVAGVMREVMEEVGGDGFLISDTPIDRRGVMEVCDGLVPELQRQGLTPASVLAPTSVTRPPCKDSHRPKVDSAA